jgi:hypothetical protein
VIDVATLATRSETWLPPVANDDPAADLKTWPQHNDAWLLIETAAPGFVYLTPYGMHAIRQTAILVRAPTRRSLYPDSLRYATDPMLRVPNARQQLADIKSWTGWSDRKVASLIGATHPTVARLRSDEPLSRIRNRRYRSRLESIHRVVSRIHSLAGRDSDRTREALEGGEVGRSAVALMESNRIGEAYLAAARKLVPGRSTRARRMRSAGRTISAEREE